MFYIIIRGPLGIGKTTIARALAEKLNAEYISFDKVLEENGIDREDNQFVTEDFIKANEIVMPKVRKAIAEGRIVIFDGCFYMEEQIKHIESNLKEGYTFDLKAPVEVCILRDSKRKKSYGEQAAREVHEMVSKFNHGIAIYTENKTKEQVIEEILAHLPKK